MLYRLDRTGDTPQLVAIDPTEMHYDADRRRMVIFPSGGVYTDVLLGWKKQQQTTLGRLISAFSKTIKPLGPESTPPVDIYIYLIEESKWPQLAEAARSHYRNESQPPEKFPEHFNPVLWSLLLKPGEKIEDIGVEEMKTRISHLTFTSLSVGSVHSLDGAACLRDGLTKAGWKPEDVADAVKELVLVNIAAVSRLDTPGPNPTRFVFTGSNDPILHCALSHYMGASKKSVRDAAGYGGKKLEKGSVEITPLDQGFHIRGHMAGKVMWDEKLEDGSLNPRKVAHVNIRYIAPTIQHNFWNFLYGNSEVGRNVRNVMLNAVMREPGIGDGHQLLLQNPLNKEHATERLESRDRANLVEVGA